MDTPTRRTMTCEALEIRAHDEGNGRSLVGHAAVFGRDSLPIFGLFVERIAPGAFKRAIDEKQDVRALVNHEPGKVLGRTAAGTLTLAEDETGLRFDVPDLPDTTYASDLAENMKRGDVTQASFGFRVVAEEWVRGGAGEMDLRILKDVDLYDVSPVTYPAYPDTDAGMRCADEDAEEAKAAHAAWVATRSQGDGPGAAAEATGTPATGLATAKARQRQAEAEQP